MQLLLAAGVTRTHRVLLPCAHGRYKDPTRQHFRKNEMDYRTELSDREMKALTLREAGLTYKEIAKRIPAEGTWNRSNGPPPYISKGRACQLVHRAYHVIDNRMYG